VVRTWLYGTVAAAALLLAGAASAAQTAQAAQTAHAAQSASTAQLGPASQNGAAHAAAAQAESTYDSLVTLYGWDDNSPPGCAIAYPQIHSCAGGVGTYSNPITFATDESEFAPGTIIYYAPLERYFIMEDDCTACDEDWTGRGPDGGPGYYHIDLWAGGAAGDNANALFSCEDSWTSAGQVPVIVDPPSNEPVANSGQGGSIFNASTSTCYSASGGGGGTGTGGGTSGPITGYQGLCLDDRSASTAPLNPVQVYTCNGTDAQQWTYSNDTLSTLGNCLDIEYGGTANGTTVDLYACNGTGAQTWEHQSDGAYLNPQSGKCLDDTGFGGSGTQAQIWSCTGSSNQSWSLP
jgi:hypothetical protein